MGRQRRIDLEDGWHHVMNRGAGRRQVFFTHGDGRSFEALLGEGCDEFGVEVHAYCLMGNHYHLLLRCPTGGLSAFMQRLGAMYTRRLNLRLGADGPVFRSRFHSILIDSPVYLDRVGRYIHRNPLDLVPRVDLDQYRWSSYRFYVRDLVRPRWIKTSNLLDMHGGSPSTYAAFVESDPREQSLRLEHLDAAIATSLDGFDDDQIGHRRGLDRLVAILILDRCDQPSRAALERHLAFPSSDARRMAVRRATRRLVTSPALSHVLSQVLDLAA